MPSIPGYFLSTLPRRHGWNLEDIGRLYNDLMVDLLGYKTYVAQGGDWVCIESLLESNTYGSTSIGFDNSACHGKSVPRVAAIGPLQCFHRKVAGTSRYLVIFTSREEAPRANSTV